MENKNSEQIETKTKKKSSYKRRLLFIMFIIIFAGSGYGYFLYTSTQKLRAEAQGIIKKADKYDSLFSEIKAEHNRCENFITQQEGSFGSFEYCKKFIEWANKINK